MGFKTDTIAAISTAMTNSGIGIVRLSGEDAFSIIDKIYKGKSPKLLSEQKSHTIHYGYIMDGEQTIHEGPPRFCWMPPGSRVLQPERRPPR